MFWVNALRQKELTQEEMKDRVCGCIETGNPDEYGDGSLLPCISNERNNELTCRTCIYYLKREDAEKIMNLFN